jgi:hypothetical protein
MTTTNGTPAPEPVSDHVLAQLRRYLRRVERLARHPASRPDREDRGGDADRFQALAWTLNSHAELIEGDLPPRLFRLTPDADRPPAG